MASEDVIVAGGTEAERGELRKAYNIGRKKMLVAVGLAFGLDPVGSSAQVRSDTPEVAGLLWAESPRDA